MSKRKRSEDSHEKWQGLLSKYEQNPLDQKLFTATMEAFSKSKNSYSRDKESTQVDVNVGLAEVAQHQGKTLSILAGSQKQVGEYEKAIITYQQSFREHLRSQQLYGELLDSRNAEYANRESYNVRITSVLDNLSRSDCHDALKDFSGSDKWRGVALRQIQDIRKGYGTYLASEEGKTHAESLNAVEKETRKLQEKNSAKITVSKKSPEKMAWLDKLSGPAGVVCSPAMDWTAYINSRSVARSPNAKAGRV